MTRTIIFANGVLTDPDGLKNQLRPTDRLICADGGTQHVLALGLTPHVVIGDLDSTPPELVAQLRAQGVSIQPYPADKDFTDLELALEFALAEQPHEILLVTALGGRLDQVLANIMLLARPAYAAIPITLLDGLQRAMMLRANQSLTLHGRVGDTLSLIPLTPTVTGVTIEQVKWPLTDVTLSFGSSFTISNEFVENQANVSIQNGLVLLVHITA